MAYETLQHPAKVWVADASGETITLRQIMTYGDSAGLTNPELLNLKGQLYVHNDLACRLHH